MKYMPADDSLQKGMNKFDQLNMLKLCLPIERILRFFETAKNKNKKK